MKHVTSVEEALELREVADLLDAPYFDVMAAMGMHSLHPGGPTSTVKAITAANVSVSEHVLEVGCGTGHSTYMLVRSGARATTIDVNPAMIAAMKRNLRRHKQTPPPAFVASATDLPLEDQTVDVVLCECVLGFVYPAEKAVSEFFRCLRYGGRIAIVDLHYHTKPDQALQLELSRVFGRTIPPRMKADWHDLFSIFELRYWDATTAIEPRRLDIGELARNLKAGPLPVTDEQLASPAMHRFFQRWNSWADLFARNRALTRSHVAVWQKV